MGAGTKDKMPLIIAARGTERWRAGGREGGGALVFNPDTLAVSENKMTGGTTAILGGRGGGGAGGETVEMR